jgi:hypothetical protein
MRIAACCALFLELLCLLPGCALIGIPTVRGCFACDSAPVSAASGTLLTRFIAIGDFGTAEGSRNRNVAMVLQRYLLSTPGQTERVFELGDNFYYQGLIGSGLSCRDLPGPPAAITERALSVLQPFEFLRDHGITLTAIPGNHDYGCGGQGLANQSDIDRWLPPAHRWGEHWELVTGEPREIILGSGTVQVILLDSERMITNSDFRDASARRLQDLLSNERERFRWRVIAAHHPLYTNGLHDGTWWKGTLARLSSFLFLPSHALAAFQVPPFDLLNQEAYSIRYVGYREAVEMAVRNSGVPVTLFLAGHDHQLQLLKPHGPGEPFIVVSGSGARCAAVRAADDTIFAAPKNGFVAVTVYPRYLDIDFVSTTSCQVQTPCASGTDGEAHTIFHYRIADHPSFPHHGAENAYCTSSVGMTLARNPSSFNGKMVFSDTTPLSANSSRKPTEAS